MLRARLIPVFGACLVGALGLVCLAAAQPQEPAADGRVGEMPLPGGVRAALAALHDPGTPDRSQFLIDVIRRTHHSVASSNGARSDVLPPLLAHFEKPQAIGVGALSAAGGPETVPLPLPAKIWTDTVFARKVKPEALAPAILRSRGASLLYLGLLSLDDATRAWLAGQADLVGWLAINRTPAFAMIAPAFRVANDRVQVPGGEAAVPAWEALVGQKVTKPAQFIRAVLDGDDRHLPYFYGMLAPLTPLQMQMALRLDAPDTPTRVAAVQRLHAVAHHVGGKWLVESRAFWRPSYDPALLAADLRTAEDGRPVVPGTRRFWQAVFAEGRPREDPQGVVNDEPADFVWLSEQVFQGVAKDQQRRYEQVLFASRVLPRLTKEQALDAIDAVRAVGRFPALVTTLERVHVTDLSVIAAAARRADRLSEIDSETRAVSALAQFQGALALLARAAYRGSLSTQAVTDHVRALSAIDLAKDDTYEGRIVRWLETNLATSDQPAANADDISASAVEHRLLELVAGPASPESRVVVWEGTRYRVDLSHAEAMRLTRVRGEAPRPYLSAARALLRMGDALDAADGSASKAGAKAARERLQHAADLLARVARAVGLPDGANWTDAHAAFGDALDRYRGLAGALPKPSANASAAGAAIMASGGDAASARTADGTGAAAPPPSTTPAAPSTGRGAEFRALADDLLARGLTEIVYATALGQPAEVGISADDAAVRHDFGLRTGGVRQRLGAWQLPMTNADSRRDSQARGSLLGLDVSLAALSLVRLSSRLPPRRPSLNEDDRRALTHAVALVEEARVTDSDRDTIAAAVRRGRERLAAVPSARDAAAVADEIGLGGMRRSLLAWIAERDRDRLAAFLSPAELLWLGLERKPVDPRLHAWGAPGEPRIGCLCLQMPDRRPWETYAGRWGTGMFVAAFPDLNLRLAELLADMRMPAALLGPVLTSATLDFVNAVHSRDPDDRRGLVAFVDALTPERMELYLGLLTTDGPLVPLGKTAEVTATMGAPR